MNQQQRNKGVLAKIETETTRTGHGVSYKRLLEYFDFLTKEELNESLRQLTNQSKIKYYENPTGKIYTTKLRN